MWCLRVNSVTTKDTLFCTKGAERETHAEKESKISGLSEDWVVFVCFSASKVLCTLCLQMLTADSLSVEKA